MDLRKECYIERALYIYIYKILCKSHCVCILQGFVLFCFVFFGLMSELYWNLFLECTWDIYDLNIF